MNGTLEQRIGQVARRQHGVVRRDQLLREGLAPRAVSRLLRAGRLRQLHRGVYLVGPVMPRLAREMAAVLACGRQARLSHASGGALWEIQPAPPTSVPPVVTVPQGVRVRRPGIRVHQSVHLAPDDVATVSAIPVTSPARTLVDLAAVVSARELERAVAAAERRGLVTLDELTARVQRHRRRPGIAALASVLRQEGGPAYTRSRLEDMFRAEVRRFGLPLPRFNPIVHGHEVDCHWPDARLVVELDGQAYHASWDQQEKDRERDAGLASTGIHVMRITWRQLARDTERTMIRVAQAMAIGRERAGRPGSA